MPPYQLFTLFDDHNQACAAIHRDDLPILETAHPVSSGQYYRDAEFMGHNRAVAEWAADIGDDGSGAGT